MLITAGKIPIVLALVTTGLASLDSSCPSNTTSTTANLIQQLCSVEKFDDAMCLPNSSNYQTYFLYGNMVVLRKWENNAGTIEPGYPKRMEELWPGVPSNVDAAFIHSTSNKTYFFKGNKFWSYTGSVLDKTSPSLIRDTFNGIPDNVDSATEWGKHIYFFKGNVYYRYDPCRNMAYFIPLSDFWGMWSSEISAVIRYPTQDAYFFRGNSYIRYNIADPKKDYVGPVVTYVPFFGCKYV